MTTGEQGRTPPDAEHYLDLSGIEEDSPGPHFDVVLRGYDRRQVDEHVAGLRRMNAQLRAQLAVRERRRSAPGPDAAALEGRLSDTIPEARRTPLAEEEVAGNPDMVGAFNDRLRGILQAAEQEAQLVRSKAAESLLAEHAESRAALAELRAQRDAVVDELVRLRGRLDDIVSGPVRPSAGPPVPPRPAASGAPGPAPGPWRGPGRPPAPPGPAPRPPHGAGRPVPPGAPAPTAVPAADGRARGQDPTVEASREQIAAAGVEDTLTVGATPAPGDATDTASDSPSDTASDTADTAPDTGPDADTGSADAVEVTEGAHPSTAATRPAPSTPERAADG
ncbi:hypothetical protein Acsp06_22430 [Actinomycetospora sp. NBRC 106375]|uniref:DivIVA domain-containing protein n=1 Tax=Actinomycetospora sp. NBRC 106375 TaxID=3032207 RepID=UPI0024A530F8|nr:hypothetical protein [Actinomycetospora sp. NBRC 106375]GLZ46058.1 hypothetical protein Acsp06_22430 [Actinomycetospora sp. NBRC 106375]